MAIRQVKKEPEIPAAHLYMEDVEEMVSVLMDVEQEKRRQQKRLTDENVTCYFIVKDRECDSVEDLKKLGGKWRNFEANVGSSSFKVTPLNTHIFVTRQSNGYQRVLQILAAREMRLRNSLRALPGWVAFPLLILIQLALYRLIPGARWREVASWGIFLGAASFYVWESMAHTVVDLRYSHEKTPKWKSIREAASKGIWIILGVILAELGHLLWEYFTKHR